MSKFVVFACCNVIIFVVLRAVYAVYFESVINVCCTACLILIIYVVLNRTVD